MSLKYELISKVNFNLTRDLPLTRMDIEIDFINNTFSFHSENQNKIKEKLGKIEIMYLVEKFKEIKLLEWEPNYESMSTQICGGYFWSLKISFYDSNGQFTSKGTNVYPSNWNTFIRVIYKIIKVK